MNDVQSPIRQRLVMHQRELLKGNTETLLLSLLEIEPMYGYLMANRYFPSSLLIPAVR